MSFSHFPVYSCPNPCAPNCTRAYQSHCHVKAIQISSRRLQMSWPTEVTDSHCHVKAIQISSRGHQPATPLRSIHFQLHAQFTIQSHLVHVTRHFVAICVHCHYMPNLHTKYMSDHGKCVCFASGIFIHSRFYVGMSAHYKSSFGRFWSLRGSPHILSCLFPYPTVYFT